MRQTVKISEVGSVKSFKSSLYSKTKKEHFLDEKNVKITKRSHALKGYGNLYKVEVLNSFNP